MIVNNSAISIWKVNLGNYDLGKSSCDGTIRILDGIVCVNGTLLNEGDFVNIDENEPILIKAKCYSILILETKKYHKE